MKRNPDDIKLSSFDEMLIEGDEICRERNRDFMRWRMNRYYHYSRENEYLEFLRRCMRHASHVGDNQIYADINREIRRWREVFEKLCTSDSDKAPTQVVVDLGYELTYARFDPEKMTIVVSTYMGAIKSGLIQEV
jgi:predicted ArsR family transcriptional regulator